MTTKPNKIIAILLLFLLLSLTFASLNISLAELEDYLWFELGTDTAIDLLWDPQELKFREIPPPWPTTSYWVDDQAKMLWLMLENPLKYESYISKSIDNLHSVYNQGYFPRRWVVLDPKVIKNDTTDCEIQNGYIKIMGDLTGQNTSNPLRIRYYEAAGYNDLTYLGGQLFIVVRLDKNYYWITYDPTHLRAEQCQTPGFDTWNEAWTNETMLLPWMFSYPKYWYHSDAPPMGCSYSARWVFEEPQTGRCIGLENYTIAQRNWRSSEFNVSENQTYTLTFKYRGDFVSGGSFKVYLRWFDSSHGFISQNYTDFSTSYASWQTFSDSYVSPIGANYSDVLFWAESNTNGSYYIDNIALSNCTILNADFEEAYGLPFDTTTYHSSSRDIGRSLKLYSNGEYAVEWLPIPTSTDRIYNITYWSKSAIPSTNITAYILYDDGTYSNLTKTCDTSDWSVKTIDQIELDANKTVVAFGFATGTVGVDTWIDDVAFNFEPVNAVTSYAVQSGYSYPETYVETFQSYADNDVNLSIKFRLSNNYTYVSQLMQFENLNYYTVRVLFTSALDGLSTVTSGEGTQKIAYSSVWIPEVGRRYPTMGAYTTTLFYPDESYKWSADHNYFIVELRQIPEWSGTYGIAVKVPVDYFYVLQNSNPNSSSPYLDYLTYTFQYTVLPYPYGTQTFNPQIICLNGYDFSDPSIYDGYFMHLENYPYVDFSMSYHIGTIEHALARYYEVKNTDPYSMGLGTWNYYRDVFTSHNNGSYLITTGEMMIASISYYDKLKDSKYLGFAEVLGDYLVNLQVANVSDPQYGTFPMKHNGKTYLDCHAACLIGLKLLRTYGASYDNAYKLGISVIHYDIRPVGFKPVIDPWGYGCQAPNIKRLFVYSNSNTIDDDFFTFKSGFVSLAAYGYNETLAMIALTRVWRNIVWTSTNLTVYVCESILGRIITGTRPDWVNTNSETQPYGLFPWLQNALHQQDSYQWYYQFLENHYAIIDVSFNETLCNVTISANNGVGTISSFYLKGTKGHVIPDSIKVNNQNVTKRYSSLTLLIASPDNCYYYDDEYELTVKSFVASNQTLQLTIVFRVVWWSDIMEPLLPLMFIIGMIGLACIFAILLYTVHQIKEQKHKEGSVSVQYEQPLKLHLCHPSCGKHASDKLMGLFRFHCTS